MEEENSNPVVVRPTPHTIEDILRHVDPGRTTRLSVSSRPFMRIDADLPRFPLLFLRRRQCLLRMALCQTIARVMMIDG